LEYIECTHCGKRYAVNSEIRKSVGDFARCKNCFEKFLLVIRDSDDFGIETQDEGFEATKGWDSALTVPPPSDPNNETDDGDNGGWDPSLTMPDEAGEQEDTSSYEPSLDDDQMQEKAQETLAVIQAEKRKKLITYILFGSVLALLALSLYMLFYMEDTTQVVNTHANVSKRLSAKELDAANLDCRQAAAKQWLLDYQAMHGKYSGKQFVDMLSETEALNQDVKKLCKNKSLLNDIISAATAGNKPEWLAAEINTLSKK
jgi:DNA-directed RNA polymerase subunit RPC12/RpoP